MLGPFALVLAHEVPAEAAVRIPVQPPQVVAGGIGTMAAELALPRAAPLAACALALAAPQANQRRVQRLKLAQECCVEDFDRFAHACKYPVGTKAAGDYFFGGARSWR